MKALVEDLVDFNRTKLGLGINVHLREIDLAETIRNEVEQLRGAYPDRCIELHVTGDTNGRWDPDRLQQLLRNLVGNALQYGRVDIPVRVALRGEGDRVSVAVANQGQQLDQAALEALFDPLKRGSVQGNGGLGLGLFIVREISRAHGGELMVRCNANETLFSVDFPRRPLT